jgi:hypothetical protein
MKKMTKILSALVVACSVQNVYAGVTVLDFDAPTILNGTIVDNEYNSVGVDISSVNVNDTNGNTSDDIIGVQIAFDTNLNGTLDPDLEYNNNSNEYNDNNSNPFAYTALEIDGVNYGETPGNVLIMQNTDNIGSCNAFVCTSPNDENGTNPAGYFEFTFDTLVDIISLDTFDIEDNGEFVIQFFAGNNLIATKVEGVSGSNPGKNVGDTVSIFDSPDYTVQAGDNTLKTMGDGQFVRQLLNITGIDRLRIQIPGSGAIDNLAFRTAEVSAPATLGLLSIALLMMRIRSRK